MLRVFSASWALIFLLLGLFLWRAFPHSHLWLLAAACSACLATGLLSPRAMRRPYRVVEWCLAPVGAGFALFVTGVVFFGLFTPYAWILRLAGWDPLHVQKKNWQGSGWRSPKAQKPGDRYFWQS